MYFCGPTVYQRAHVGNARPFVFGMWLRSWLRFRGYDVTLAPGAQARQAVAVGGDVKLGAGAQVDALGADV